MRVGLLGRKVGMTQIYESDGTAVPSQGGNAVPSSDGVHSHSR